VAANTNALIDQAKCIDLCVPRGMQLAVLIGIFADIAGMDPTDTNALIRLGTCIDGCIPPGMQLAVLNGLINSVTNGDVGGTQIFCGTGSPINGTANPNPGNPSVTCAIWIQSDSVPPNQTSAIWINGSWQ
jgi:hypothetical protein